MVKSLFFIPLALLMLMQSIHMGADDIAKIPDLMEHYQEHQNKYGDDLFSFINKHYGADKDKHESQEKEQHHDLPFNHSHHVCIDMKVDIPTVHIELKENITDSKDYFVYRAPFTMTRTYSILQPPKHNC